MNPTSSPIPHSGTSPTRPTDAPHKRALVLGGGGAAGNAWQLGLIAGLADAGIDTTTADLIVGTSSGSTVAAQITSGTRPADLYAAILSETPPRRPSGSDVSLAAAANTRPATANGRHRAERSTQHTESSVHQADDPTHGAEHPRVTPGSLRAAPGDLRTTPDAPHATPGNPRTTPMSGPSYLEWSNALIASASDASDMRRTMGAAALHADASRGAASARWHDIVASRLPSQEWPKSNVLIVAVDANTGEPVTFSRDSGVSIVDAVAASTSAMTPYRIGDASYINGGYRRNENADLAEGYEGVLVMSPFSGRTRYPLTWGMQLEAQVAELRAAGSTVQTVFPGARAGDVFDANALDLSTRRQAALGGYRQAAELATVLAGWWSVP